MALFAKMLVDLEDAPNVTLVVLLMFRINGVQLAHCTGWSEQRGVEETCKSFKSTMKCRCGDTEEIVCVGCTRERVRMSVVLRQVLRVDVRTLIHVT